jgi:hypothetical protein
VRTAWCYGYWARRDQGLYACAEATLVARSYAIEFAQNCLDIDAAAGDDAGKAISLLIPVAYWLFDVDETKRQGHFTESEAAFIKECAFQAVRSCDATLADEIERALGAYIGKERPTRLALPPVWGQLLIDAQQGLRIFYRQYLNARPAPEPTTAAGIGQN